MSGMKPEDVYELTWAAEPRLSPDGATVAFTVTRIDRDANEYRSAIWLAPVDGSAPPRAFTSGAKRDLSPRWSPDGTRLAFVSTRERDHAQLYVIDAAGGEARMLTDLPESVEDPVWSPDGSRIAFAARTRDAEYAVEEDARRAPRRITRLSFKLDDEGWTTDRRRHLYTVPSDGSEPPSQLTFGDFEDRAPAWSPDGETIAFASARSEHWDVEWTTDLYLVEAKGGEPVALSDSAGAYDAPSWSPDGRSIACRFTPGIYDEPRHARIAVVDVASGTRRVLTEALDRNCAPFPGDREPLWDGDDIVFGVEDAGGAHLYRVRADGGAAPVLIAGGERWIGSYDVAGGALVHAQTTAVALGEIYAGERRLTDVAAAFAEAREIVAPERFTAISRDGSEVEAWVIRPVGFKTGARYPALLNIHGGPFTQYGYKFHDEFQVQAGAGYVVLYANPRGSSGYGEAWGRAIRGPGEAGPGWGSVDYEDLMAVVEEALRRFDFVDPARLGVLGGSYGGYMTSWIVSHDDRFKAACSERALNDWYSMFGSSDVGAGLGAYVGRTLAEDRDAYLRMSPTTYAADIRTPLLIMHSEDDLRCDVEQAEQLFTALRVLRRPVEMVRFPAEGHELSRSGSPVHRVQRFEILLEWFARHLAQ